LITGGIALGAFVLVELRATVPLLELRVFRSIGFSVGLVVQGAGQFALSGTLFLVPLFLQQARGYGAFATGVSLLPYALAAAVCMPLGGMLFDRIGARLPVTVGLGLMAVALILLSRVNPATGGSDLTGPLALMGAGTGLMLMTLTTYLVRTAPRNLVSRVTALTNAVQRVVTSLTIAGLATILTAQTATQMNAARGTLAGQDRFRAGSTGLPLHGSVTHEAPALATAMQRALATAFDTTFQVMVLVAIAGVVLGLALRRRRTKRTSSVDDLAGEADWIAS
jgi:MFS family permease